MIYTFYSFKGGVGRSMAMASVAWLLAARGLRVLAIDFDLEAPGLERYFFDASGATAIKARPGLIDLLLAYKRALTNEEEFRKGEFRDWRRFVQAAIPSLAGGGRVDIMSAGQREPQERYATYAAAVRSFDWMDFFQHWKGERFFDWLRAEIASPDAYDVVLVDSRTGITEMGGVCAYQLADIVVMLCAANEQNLDGTLRVARDFRSDATLAMRKGRPLELLVIPARLELNNERRQDFLDQFARTFDRASFLPKQLYELELDYERLAIPYEPAFAIIEQIVGERATERGVAAAAAKTFERLADALTLLAWRDGKLRDGQEAARKRILGQEGGADGTHAQVADPTKVAADFDFFLEEGSASSSNRPLLEPGLRQAGLRVGSFAAEAPTTKGWSQPVPLLQASRALLVRFDGGEVSPWTSQLIDAARRTDLPILPIVVASSPESPAWSALRSASLGHIAPVQLDERDPSGWVPAVLGAWRQFQGGAQAQPAEEDEAEPYPGARPFTEGDAGFFFGRAEEIQALAALVEDNAITLLTGPAGVGKTSLVRAGLLPELRKRGEADPARGWRVWQVDLAQAEGAEHGVEDWVRAAQGQRGLAVIDGIDSFPQGGDASAVAARIGRVRELLAALPPEVHALLVLRNTFDAAQRAEALEQWGLRSGRCGVARHELAPMGAEALTQAIEKPAGRLGHVVDPGLTTLLLNQAGTGPGAISEVARALPLLWQGRRRGWLTAAPLEAHGGIAGVFQRAWESFARELGEVERRDTDALVRTLSRLDGSMRWTGRPAEWAMLATLGALAGRDPVALRDRLAAGHFIELWAPPAAASPQEPLLAAGEPLVALVHDQPALYGAAHAAPFDAGFLLWRDRFASFVRTWQQAGRSSAALLPEQALAEAQVQAQAHPELLSEAERKLIDASRERHGQALKAASRQRALRVFTLMLVLLVLVAGGAIYWLNEARNEARFAAEYAQEVERRALEERQTALRQNQEIIAQLRQLEQANKLELPALPKAPPLLSSPQQQTLDVKARGLTNDDAAAPRADQPAGAKYWRNGSTLRVRFLGGTERQHAMARAAAQEWMRYANLKFTFVSAGDAEVRISFEPGNGSWAYQGTDALGVQRNEPTMNLGFDEPGAALHEFGHVLGLIHENQNPNAKLPWDRGAVYRELTGPPNFWSRSQVDDTVLTPVRISGYRAFDPDSIMLYRFEGKMFTDGVARGGRQVLSAGDKAFAGKLYPR